LIRAHFGHALLALLAGLLVVTQSRINGQLSSEIGDGLFAAVVSFAVGLLVLIVLVALRGQDRRAFHALPMHLRVGDLSWWMLIGGLGGATLVAAQGIGVPVIGVALFSVALVAGQTTNALVVDHFGLGPKGVAVVTPARMTGAACAVVAVVVAVSGRSGTGDFALGLVVFASIAGALVAAQQAVNGRVAAATGRPAVAGLVNFLAGFAGLVLVWLVTQHHAVALPGFFEKPVLYLGGPLGVAFIVMAAVVVRTLGVLLFGMLAVAGQLVGALVFDLAIPTPGTALSWQLVAGTVLTFVGVAIAAGAPRSRT
jgi:transporter family-2 protein